MQVIKRAKVGFAFALASMFSANHANKPQWRGATAPRKRGREQFEQPEHAHANGHCAIKIVRAFGGRDGTGRATARHGIPYNDRETMMRLRAMVNGATVRIVRDPRSGKIVNRLTEWPKAVVK